MKINLKKVLIFTKISSSIMATIGLSCFIVGGYGNNINSLSQIQNSGYFGLDVAFNNEKTKEINTKEKYVNFILVSLKKTSETSFVENTNKIIAAEEEINKIMKIIIEPLETQVDVAWDDFQKNRTNKNKQLWEVAKNALAERLNNEDLSTQKNIILNNNKIILNIKQSEEDISKINNYELWNDLFISGLVFLVFGSVILISSMGYSVYLKKNKNKND